MWINDGQRFVSLADPRDCHVEPVPGSIARTEPHRVVITDPGKQTRVLVTYPYDSLGEAQAAYRMIMDNLEAGSFFLDLKTGRPHYHAPIRETGQG